MFTEHLEDEINKLKADNSYLESLILNYYKDLKERSEKGYYSNEPSTIHELWLFENHFELIINQL